MVIERAATNQRRGADIIHGDFGETFGLQISDKASLNVTLTFKLT
jgi:hypothetical protein